MKRVHKCLKINHSFMDFYIFSGNFLLIHNNYRYSKIREREIINFTYLKIVNIDIINVVDKIDNNKRIEI